MIRFARAVPFVTALILLTFVAVVSSSAAVDGAVVGPQATVVASGGAIVAPGHAAPVYVPPHIEYRYSARYRRSCQSCQPTIQTVLLVPDKRKCHCGQLVEVPICLPACCLGEPSCSSHRGLFGRGKAVYTWCCGFKIVVVVKKCGDLVVTYVG